MGAVLEMFEFCIQSEFSELSKAITSDFFWQLLQAHKTTFSSAGRQPSRYSHVDIYKRDIEVSLIYIH